METNNIELGIVPEVQYKIVPEAAIARKLRKDGFVIADIKPKKGRPNESIFVFEVKDGFYEKLAQYTQERKSKYEQEKEEKEE